MLNFPLNCIMRDIVLFRKARVTEASLLTSLTVRSKAYWGYSEDFMEACADELVVPMENLQSQNHSYIVVESNDELIGYYGLEPVSATKIELSALFIEPKFIGRGLGKAILTHAMKSAFELGGKELTFESDPNAEGFYLANGAIITGKKESLSFSGRYLPTFSIMLQSGTDATKEIR